MTENYEAAIRLTLRGVAGKEYAIEAIIDTGFTDWTLPTTLIDRLNLSWQGKPVRSEEVDVFEYA